MENVISLSMLEKVNIFEQLWCLLIVQIKAQWRSEEKSRHTIKYYWLLQGHDENELSENRGVSKGLVNFMTALDPSLQNHIESNSGFKGTPKTIQNELMYCMLEVCQEDIMTEINETYF